MTQMAYYSDCSKWAPTWASIYPRHTAHFENYSAEDTWVRRDMVTTHRQNNSNAQACHQAQDPSQTTFAVV